MNILLLSMPDAFEHMSPVTIRMPNGALGSLAGNLDAGHRAAIADLGEPGGSVHEGPVGKGHAPDGTATATAAPRRSRGGVGRPVAGNVRPRLDRVSRRWFG